MRTKRRFGLGGPPLALQIMALLVGGLLVAQLVTLVLTLALPPAPAAQYGLDDIAATLGGASGGGRAKGLQRVVQAGPPDVGGSGWLVSDGSRKELAHLMGVDESRVSLAFYTPLPFAGTTAPRALAMANDGFVRSLKGESAGTEPASLLLRAQFSPPPGVQPGFGIPGTPQARALPGQPGFGLPGAAPNPFHGNGPGRGGRPPMLLPPGVARTGRTRPLVTVETPGQAAVRLPDDALDTGKAVSGASGYGGEFRTRAAAAQSLVTTASGPVMAAGSAVSNVRTGATPIATDVPLPLLGADARLAPLPRGATLGAPDRDLLSPPVPVLGRSARTTPPLLATVPPSATSQASASPRGVPASLPLALPEAIVLAPSSPTFPSPPAPNAAPAPGIEATPAGPPIRIASPHRTLFGLAPAPFVEGDFVAALKLGEGRWAVVQPAPEPFPNAWQRRVLLWFAIALALVVPVGWLFARRLVKPLDRFAGAAERLGRDPAAAIGALDGPAEIGRAAHAFNLMQNRLRAFVDDRTAMVGAISHDLRTPLTRMRFRLEEIDDGEVREGLLEEVDEMEAMIAQVIDFLRDASAPAPRERLDLGVLVEDVVQDVRLVGGDVRVEHTQSAQVEVDVLGMKRLLDNLLENAVKYGIRARVRLRTDLDEAVAEIIDDGPGLPEEEMERVFEPFYRGESARASDRSGSGLGLAVCRSIARAHGGDIRLRRLPEGFAAELRVPLVYGSEKPALV